MAAGQLPLDFPHRQSLSGDDFLIAPSNAESVAWLDKWPQWGTSALIIHGPAGCGKTHLLHTFMAQSGAVPVTPGLLRETDPAQLLANVRTCVVDDADEGHNEEELLHLYNSVNEIGGHMLLAAARPPGRWGIALADLASRLKAAQTVAIGRPDDDLIAAVLIKLFSDHQLRVSADAIAFAVPRMERSLDAARKLVAAVDVRALEKKREITLALIREVLSGA